MKFVLIIIFATILLQVTPQLVRDPAVLHQLHEITNDEPYKIQSIKGTLYDERQSLINPKASNDTQIERNGNIAPEINFPKYRIKYKTQKSQIKDEPSIRLDTENAIINVERNDTVEVHRQIIEFDSMNIQTPNKSLNMLNSFKENNEDEIIYDDLFNYVENLDDSDVDYTKILFDNHSNEDTDEDSNNTRRLIADTHYLPPIIYDVENVPHSYRGLENIQEENSNNPDDNVLDENDKFESDASSKESEEKCAETKGNERSSEQTTDLDDKSDIFFTNFKNKTPTEGNGISKMVKTRMMLLGHPRVCFACNSIKDPTCWSPNRKTSVKYCRRDHNSCMTKVFTHKGKPYILRDCTNQCSSKAEARGGVAYASCTICENDLCNSAQNITIQNIVPFIFVIINLFFYWNDNRYYACLNFYK